jgi:hypothetical protein
MPFSGLLHAQNIYYSFWIKFSGDGAQTGPGFTALANAFALAKNCDGIGALNRWCQVQKAS